MMHLHEWLKQKKLTDQQFADMIGCSRSAVTHYRAGRRMPSPYTMLEIQKVTDGEVTWDDMVENWQIVRKDFSI